MENIFNIKRTMQLFKREMYLNASNIYVAFAAITGVLFVVFALMAYSQNASNYNNMAGLFFIVYFIGGFIFSSRSFNEISDYRSAYHYLTLPTSNFEKLLVNWLTSSVLYSALAIVVFVIISSLANLLSSSILGFEYSWFNLETHYIFQSIGVYLVLQPIFIFGSLYFKKQPFLRTIFALFLVGIAFTFIIAILGWGIVSDFSAEGIKIKPHNVTTAFSDFFENIFPEIMRILFWFIIGPFMLLVSYFRLKETEI